jgi:hypothetical protein
MSAISDLQPILDEAARLRECALDAVASAAEQFRRAEHELTRLDQQMRCLEFLQRLD